MSGALLYTDVNLLPLSETVRNLPDEEDLTEILTNISGKTCLNGSWVVATDQSGEATETSLTVGDRRALSQSDDLREWWRWRESNPRPMVLLKRCLHV